MHVCMLVCVCMYVCVHPGSASFALADEHHLNVVRYLREARPGAALAVVLHHDEPLWNPELAQHIARFLGSADAARFAGTAPSLSANVSIAMMFPLIVNPSRPTFRNSFCSSCTASRGAQLMAAVACKPA